MAVIYTNEESLTIEVLCLVDTEEAGWELANEMNKKGDGNTYWVEAK